MMGIKQLPLPSSPAFPHTYTHAAKDKENNYHSNPDEYLPGLSPVLTYAHDSAKGVHYGAKRRRGQCWKSAQGLPRSSFLSWTLSLNPQ